MLEIANECHFQKEKIAVKKIKFISIYRTLKLSGRRDTLTFSRLILLLGWCVLPNFIGSVCLMLTVRKTQTVRAFYIADQDRAAFVDVSCVQNAVHDFSDPDLTGYFDHGEAIQRVDLLHLHTMTQYVLYWRENNQYPVNDYMQDRWGITYRGKILVFKRRADAMRYSSALRRYHLDAVMECIKWYVFTAAVFPCPDSLSLIPVG